MKNKSLKMRISELSLRRQILLISIFSVFFMSVILFSTMHFCLRSVNVLGSSYLSNIDLSSFSKVLEETENALENYVNYHTFDSIDSFYANRVRVENFTLGMLDKPSENEIQMKNYIVRKLSESFIYYSTKTISARRANNDAETELFFIKSSRCYSMLIFQLLELNTLVLEENTDFYEKNYVRSGRIIKLSAVLFVILSGIVLLFLYFTITAVIKPLSDISNVAIRVSKRDFDVPLFNNEKNNEIGNICRAFDRMIVSIREYIDTIWEKAITEAELKEKEMEMQALYTDAQLRALQNQINPHFLFNTLNTGVQLSMMEGADKTSYFLEQVSDFFRYNIQNQKETATIDEELGLIDNFVYIMKVRFGNRLEFIKNISKESFNELIPVMTLQPLVEDCIKYSLKNEKGIVELCVERKESFVVISVSDNGDGMPAEIREEIMNSVKEDITRLPQEMVDRQNAKDSKLEKHNGTGLINVFSRLKLFFLRDDLFFITSSDNKKGTKFIIRIPENV